MRYLLCVYVFIFCLSSCQQSTKKVEQLPEQVEKRVFFKNIVNGDTLTSPFQVEMGVSGMKVKPAGVLSPGTGHHHIIINKGFIKYGEIIPMDETHLHYGKGDTLTDLNLLSGEYTLTLQFANGLHMSYGEQFSNTITIYVK